jgi:hypothetical protein
MENELQQINPEFLKELEAISLQPMSAELPELPQNEMTAAAVKVPPVVIPPLQGFNNCCGQAAVTSVLDAWGKNKYEGRARLMLLLRDIYKWYPPDIFHGSFGTSANRMISALKDMGLKNTISLRLEPWIIGGFGNPANVVAYQAYSKMVFSYVNAGYPAIVMVDNGKLGDKPLVFHWLVLYEANNNGVLVCNAITKTQGYHRRSYDYLTFSQAWEAAALASPGFRFNVVIAFP